MQTAVKIDPNDIFRYVVGNTTVDPIEAQINKRYEVFDEFLYDHESKTRIAQSKDFVDFSKKISDLRKMSASLARQFIVDRCEELSKVELDVDLG
jgi:hypothetical protein